jgi:hypothetical protein
MASQIPHQLAYLQSVLTDLAQFEPDDLGDDNPEAIAIVEAAVRRRVKGMTPDDDAALLN